jgi:hypothetical protein
MKTAWDLLRYSQDHNQLKLFKIYFVYPEICADKIVGFGQSRAVFT